MTFLSIYIIVELVSGEAYFPSQFTPLISILNCCQIETSLSKLSLPSSLLLPISRFLLSFLHPKRNSDVKMPFKAFRNRNCSVSRRRLQVEEISTRGNEQTTPEEISTQNLFHFTVLFSFGRKPFCELLCRRVWDRW